MNSFHKFIQLSVAIVCGLLTPAYNADPTTSFTDYDEGYHISPCHVWRTGDPDVNNFDLIRNYKLEEYREELVHRIIGSDAYQTAYHIEKSTNLTIESTQAFPLGVPHEFSFECTFRTERPPTRPWYLFYLSDYEYSSQLSVTINPLHGSIDFALPLFDGTLFTASFLDSKIFNGLWHKVMLGLTQDSVRLWVDCKPAHDKYGRERVPLDHRAQIDAADGYFTLAQDVGSGSTVPIDLQWMVLSCDSDKPNRTSCEELPQYDLKFKDPDVVEPESEEERPILMASAGRTTTCPETCPRGPPGRDGSPGPPGPPGSETPTSLLRGDKGQKGEVGMVGIEGIPGQKGEPGEVATSGFVKEILQQFYEESKGLKGEKGEPGNLDKQFLDNHIEELKGEKGEPGPIGMAGVPGLPGYRGQKGEPGSKFENIQPNISHYRGQKGERGYPGAPGPPGLVNKELIVSGEKGEPGENGHPGMVGLPGTRGLPGPQGPAGICTCEPNANPGPPGESGEKGSDGPQGLPGYEGTPGFPGPPGPPGPPGSPGLPGARESFRYEESEIRDICMGVIREYITEIQTTLVGTPGATSRRIAGKTGRPGPKGPPGEPGPQGPRGDMGFVGLPGLPGLKGDMGIPGLDGLKGNQGDDGIGRDGQPGPQGPPGVDGQPGRDGISGRPGDRGDPGMPGTPGMRGPPGEPGTCTSCPYLSYPQFYQQQQTKGPSNVKG